jgi:hypothetical protein
MTTVTTADGPGPPGPSAIGFAFHDTNVYWVDGATVMRAPRAGGAPEVVMNVGGPDSIVGMGLDPCNVFVTVESSDQKEFAIWGEGLSAAASASCGEPYAVPGDDDASTDDRDASTVDASVTTAQLQRDTCSD